MLVIDTVWYAPGLLFCADSRSTTTQKTEEAIRRNRAHVQVRLEWLRKGLRYLEPFERTRYDAEPWTKKDAGR